MTYVRSGCDEEQARSSLARRRVVTIGGGAGQFALLSRLKNYPCSVTAIVPMCDGRGSSRRLMDEFGQLPVGDLRQALVALSRKGALWRDLFAYQFNEQIEMAAREEDCTPQQRHMGVGGHSLGNLILTALQELSGDDLLTALAGAQKLLDTAGMVLPVSLTPRTLCAELENGEIVCGEAEIDVRGSRSVSALAAIRRIFLDHPASACIQAVRAIREADLIVLGPGDLYTSVLPNMLVDGIASAIRTSSARKFFVCNLMTKRGETDGFKASDFVREIHRYLGAPVDRVILHDGTLPDDVRAAYAARHQRPVRADVELAGHLAAEFVVDDLLAVEPSRLARHDADRLIHAITSPSAQMVEEWAVDGHEAAIRLPA